MRRRLARRERLYVFEIDSATIARLGRPEVPGITTRAITPADALALGALTPPGETIERLALGDLGEMAVADDGRVVGCTWLAARDMPAPHHLLPVRPAPGEAYGYGLRVAPAMRRRGVGRALVVASRVRGIEQGLDRVVSHVEFANDASLALQRSIGAVARKQLNTIILLERFPIVLRSITPE